METIKLPNVTVTHQKGKLTITHAKGAKEEIAAEKLERWLVSQLRSGLNVTTKEK